MHIQRALALFAFVALLVCAAIPGSAATPSPSGAMMSTVPLGSQIITVNDCSPSLNLKQSGGMYAGYPVGYAGGYWRDPYGVRYYQPPVTTANPQLAIHYRNISHKTMSEIQFGLVSNQALLAEVKDVGKFSPGAEIKHKFGLSANAFPIRGIPHCYPLHITFADGTTWTNPKLPPKNATIYNNHP